MEEIIVFDQDFHTYYHVNYAGKMDLITDLEKFLEACLIDGRMPKFEIGIDVMQGENYDQN